MPCTDSRYPVPDAAKQHQNITEPPPCFTVDMVFFSLKGRGANVSCQKAPVLTHLSKEHSSRKIPCTLNFLKNIFNCCHRNIKQLGHGLVLYLYHTCLLFSFWAPQTTLCFAFSGPCSVSVTHTMIPNSPATTFLHVNRLNDWLQDWILWARFTKPGKIAQAHNWKKRRWEWIFTSTWFKITYKLIKTQIPFQPWYLR